MLQVLGCDPYRYPETRERLMPHLRMLLVHLFHVVKNLFKYRMTGYKGLTKNGAQLYSLIGLANLVIAMKQLIALDA